MADIPPAPRTPEEVITAVFGPHRDRSATGGDARPGPVAEGKTVFASAAHPIAEVIADGFAEAERRDPGHDRTWYALVDGNNAQIDAINAQARAYDVGVPILIDFICAMRRSVVSPAQRGEIGGESLDPMADPEPKGNNRGP